jgi:hypothetical protein
LLLAKYGSSTAGLRLAASHRTQHLLGLQAFALALLLNVARIYDVYHFPSDVVGSIGLALIIVTLFRNRSFRRAAYRIVTWGLTKPALFYALSFLLTYQIASLFIDLRELGRLSRLCGLGTSPTPLIHVRVWLHRWFEA